MTDEEFNNLNPNGYILIDTYGVLAFPVECIPMLMKVIRLNSKYSSGHSTPTYEVQAEEMIGGKLMPTAMLKAIIAASKLEGECRGQ